MIYCERKLFYKFQSWAFANTPRASSRQQGSARIRSSRRWHLKYIHLRNQAVFVGSFLSQTWLGYDRKESCRFKMLSDSRDGWAIPTKGRVDGVCYSSNPDNSLRSLFKRKCKNTPSHVCAVVILFYFKSIFAFQRVFFSWLYSAKSLSL